MDIVIPIVFSGNACVNGLSLSGIITVRGVFIVPNRFARTDGSHGRITGFAQPFCSRKTREFHEKIAIFAPGRACAQAACGPNGTGHAFQSEHNVESEAVGGSELVSGTTCGIYAMRDDVADPAVGPRAALARPA